jgi:hypothetical protein
MPFVPPEVDPGTNEPKREVVGIVYDRMTESVKAQVLRDFLRLTGEFQVSYSDQKGLMETSIFDILNVTKASEGSPIALFIVYKTGEEWPESPLEVPRIERDLCPPDGSPSLSGEPRVGYFIKPQGRTGANLTLRYLNRAYPRGRGLLQPWLQN